MTAASHNRAFALLLMLGSTIALSCMHGIIRLLGDEVHPFIILFLRNLFGLVAVAPLLLRSGADGLKTQDMPWFLLRAAISVTAMAAWFYALTRAPITEATALSFTAAMFASLAAVVLLGERVRARRITAMACGFIGVLIVLRPTTQALSPAMVLVLFSSVCWGVSVVLAKRLTARNSSTTIVAWMTILLSVISLPMALWAWHPLQLSHWLWMLLGGTLATIGHLSMTQALRMTDTTAVMSIDFFRLIWATLIGVLAFCDPLHANTYVGAVIIFAAGLYITYRESRLAEPRTPSS
ncbi:MAG: DMT family transporter [Pseudomonadota bacterium]